MSLETIYKRLRNFEKIPFWKFVHYFGVIPSLISLAVVPFTSPTAMKLLENPAEQLMLGMAFMAMYVTLVGGSLATGILLTLFLIKLRDKFHYNHGIVIGKSLATNDEFLRDLAKGLDTHLKKLRTDDVDLKIQELDAKYQNLIQELERKHDLKIEQLDVKYQKEIDEVKTDFMRELRIKNLAVQKERNLRIQAERENEEKDKLIEILKKEKSIKEQQIGDRIHAKDIDENTKIDDQNKKFEPRD